jgi:hypothetical protein
LQLLLHRLLLTASAPFLPVLWECPNNLHLPLGNALQFSYPVFVVPLGVS